jgi:hypothetical protein
MMFLTARPLWLSGIILIGSATLLAMAGPIAIRRRVGLDRLAVNNEVAGFKFATVGVLYAVLLAFVVIVVWERFNEAETDAAQEAVRRSRFSGWLTGWVRARRRRCTTA